MFFLNSDRNETDRLGFFEHPAFNANCCLAFHIRTIRNSNKVNAHTVQISISAHRAASSVKTKTHSLKQKETKKKLEVTVPENMLSN